MPKVPDKKDEEQQQEDNPQGLTEEQLAAVKAGVPKSQEELDEEEKQAQKAAKSVKDHEGEKVKVMRFKLLRGIHRQKDVETGAVRDYRPGEVVVSPLNLTSKLGADKFSPLD